MVTTELPKMDTSEGVQKSALKRNADTNNSGEFFFFNFLFNS